MIHLLHSASAGIAIKLIMMMINNGATFWCMCETVQIAKIRLLLGK